MRGTAATGRWHYVFTDLGEINARKSTKYFFLDSVGSPLTGGFKLKDMMDLVRHGDCALLRRGSERMELWYYPVSVRKDGFNSDPTGV